MVKCGAKEGTFGFGGKKGKRKGREDPMERRGENLYLTYLGGAGGEEAVKNGKTSCNFSKRKESAGDGGGVAKKKKGGGNPS